MGAYFLTRAQLAQERVENLDLQHKPGVPPTMLPNVSPNAQRFAFSLLAHNLSERIADS